MMRLLSSALLVSSFAAAILLPACSSDSNTPQDQFFSDYCDLMSNCCANKAQSADASKCKTALSILASGTYDQSKADACISEMRQSLAQNGTCKAKSCEYVFQNGSSGTKKPGETCDTSSDCQASSEGDVSCAFSSTGSSGTYTGTCQIRATGKEGDSPCVATAKSADDSYASYGLTPPAYKGYVCYLTDGLYCDNPGKGTCTKTKAIGDACSSFYGDECGLGGYCDTATTSSVCKARLADGSACSSYSSSCQPTSTCDTATQKCKALLADGSACTSGSQCQSSYCANNVCSGNSDNLLCIH
jgi:hypothetical protein